MTSNTDVAPHSGEVDRETASTVGDAAPASTGRGWPLTVYFALLVAVVAIGAAAAIVYVYVQTDRDSRRAAERNAGYSANVAATQLGEGIATVGSTVTGLAKTPNLAQAAEQPTCTLSFDVGELSTGHLDVLRPDGSVACSSRPRAASPAAARSKA